MTPEYAEAVEAKPTPLDMTRAVANEILTLWRTGAAVFSRQQINLALYMTGDLDSPL